MTNNFQYVILSGTETASSVHDRLNDLVPRLPIVLSFRHTGWVNTGFLSPFLKELSARGVSQLGAIYIDGCSRDLLVSLGFSMGIDVRTVADPLRDKVLTEQTLLAV